MTTNTVANIVSNPGQSAGAFCPSLSQVALSVIDLERTEAWFREGLGFLSAGGNRLLMSGPIASRVQGLPGAASCAWWLVGRNQWFQFELFQFRRPMAKLMPADFRACDIGYSRIGVHVFDFDATLENLARLGSEPLSAPVGERGQRRVCVRSPDGVYVEILEDDPLPQAAGSERDNCPVAVRSVTMSTPDLDASVAYLTAVGGRAPEEISLHTPEHESTWGLPGAQCRRAVFRAGDILIEVVQYLDPVAQSRPKDYRICDQGILNIAYGARNKADHTRVYERAIGFGAQPNYKPIHLGGAGVVYMNDALGFSVEIMWLSPGKMDVKYGFEPLPLDRYPRHDNLQVNGRVRLNASVEKVWRVLSEQNAMSKWIGFDSVRRTRDGSPDVDGYGAERLMAGKPGKLVEQITGVEPERVIRYRVTEGGPVIYHNGEIQLRPDGDGCEVDWTIRCRSKIPFVGGLLRRVMQKMLDGMLQQGLKAYVER